MPITFADLGGLASEPVNAADVLNSLAPPPHFAGATFESYLPDPNYPSQSLARDLLRSEVQKIGQNLRGSFFNRKRAEPVTLYLDGGFGIGKTHLLAAAYHYAQTTKKAFLSFQELMFIVGLLGLTDTIKNFGEFRLLVIDEFELDDPANIRISSNMLDKLYSSGVSILTSSNTPPGALGADCFNADAFARELGVIGKRFRPVSIDGRDYRYTHPTEATGHSWYRSDERDAFTKTADDLCKARKNVLYLSGVEFIKLLGSVHPIKLRIFVKSLDTLIVNELPQLLHHHDALRFVYCIDKLYDDDTSFVVLSDTAQTDIFHPSLFKGGDIKRYRRALSRLNELSSIGF